MLNRSRTELAPIKLKWTVLDRILPINDCLDWTRTKLRFSNRTRPTLTIISTEFRYSNQTVCTVIANSYYRTVDIAKWIILFCYLCVFNLQSFLKTCLNLLEFWICGVLIWGVSLYITVYTDSTVELQLSKLQQRFENYIYLCYKVLINETNDLPYLMYIIIA